VLWSNAAPNWGRKGPMAAQTNAKQSLKGAVLLLAVSHALPSPLRPPFPASQTVAKRGDRADAHKLAARLERDSCKSRLPAHKGAGNVNGRVSQFKPTSLGQTLQHTGQPALLGAPRSRHSARLRLCHAQPVLTIRKAEYTTLRAVGMICPPPLCKGS